MDASQGFYQIQLDEESKQLCTVASPFGRYSFKRLPYGINCAPEIFHAKIQQLFESETGVKVFMDDIVLTNKRRARRSTEEGVCHRQTLWTQTEREKVRIWCHRIDVLRRKANTSGNQARSGQSCWNLQHASTHDQRGGT